MKLGSPLREKSPKSREFMNPGLLGEINIQHRPMREQAPPMDIQTPIKRSQSPLRDRISMKVTPEVLLTPPDVS